MADINHFYIASAILHLAKRFAEDHLGKDAAKWTGPLSDLAELGLNEAIAELLSRRVVAPGLEFETE